MSTWFNAKLVFENKADRDFIGKDEDIVDNPTNEYSMGYEGDNIIIMNDWLAQSVPEKASTISKTLGMKHVWLCISDFPTGYAIMELYINGKKVYKVNEPKTDTLEFYALLDLCYDGVIITPDTDLKEIGKKVFHNWNWDDEETFPESDKDWKLEPIPETNKLIQNSIETDTLNSIYYIEVIIEGDNYSSFGTSLENAEFLLKNSILEVVPNLYETYFTNSDTPEITEVGDIIEYFGGTSKKIPLNSTIFNGTSYNADGEVI